VILVWFGDLDTDLSYNSGLNKGDVQVDEGQIGE